VASGAPPVAIAPPEAGRAPPVAGSPPVPNAPPVATGGTGGDGGWHELGAASSGQSRRSIVPIPVPERAEH
jgi:hypothetical protein